MPARRFTALVLAATTVVLAAGPASAAEARNESRSANAFGLAVSAWRVHLGHGVELGFVSLHRAPKPHVGACAGVDVLRLGRFTAFFGGLPALHGVAARALGASGGLRYRF